MRRRIESASPETRSRALRDSSIAELRSRFLEAGEPVSARALGILRGDPRTGVRSLAEQLAHRREKDRTEARRMESLLELERTHWARGFERIAGTDEVGVGPLAGPVVAAATILPQECQIAGVNDSKQLTPEQREELDLEIRERAIAVGVGLATVAEIEEINIRQAGFLAMRRALEALDPEPDFVLVDAHQLEGLRWPQEARIKADASVHCVACASVVAKVHRDQLMIAYDAEYPGYGFAQHKGYGTASHLDALEELGPSPIHRQSFHWAGRQLSLF